MIEPPVIVEQPMAEVARVTLNRPSTLNAMDDALVEELQKALDEIAGCSDVRVVVLTGSGRGFCSGFDLSEILPAEPAARSIRESYAVQERFARLVRRVRTMPQAVIAAVNGPAAGGGLALALAADTRLAAASARFNAAFVRLGISGCELGVSYLLPRLVGPSLAFEMMLTGRLVDAQEAHEWGLVLRVVPDEDLADAALELAGQICRNSPLGIRMTKQVMWANLSAGSIEAAMELENRTQVLCAETADHREAVAAFVGRRDPIFEDR